MDEFSRALVFHSTAFDAFLSDVGTALLSGAALCLEDSAALQGSLLEVMAARQITHADLPPSLLAMLDPERAPKSLKTIVIGGEVCPASVVRRWARQRNVVNVYGPTEATVCTSQCRCDPNTWGRPLLGRPLAGIEYVLLKADGTRASGGEEGELLIGGPCLARGYVNRAVETAARFVFYDGRRFFRTGDRVRLDHDGEFVFLGRLDRQIKLRGLRIELEEIEAVLCRIPGIRRCAVVCRKLSPAARREQLVAFLESDGTLPRNQVLATLRQSLPAWMVPARIEVQVRLPITASGKIDLELLRTRNLSSAQIGAADSDAEEPQAALLLRVFRSVLGVEGYGLHDDFFEHGGDSLSVFEVVACAPSRPGCSAHAGGTGTHDSADLPPATYRRRGWSFGEVDAGEHWRGRCRRGRPGTATSCRRPRSGRPGC